MLFQRNKSSLSKSDILTHRHSSYQLQSFKNLTGKGNTETGWRAPYTSNEGNTSEEADRQNSFLGSWGPGAVQEEQQERVPATCCTPDYSGTEPTSQTAGPLTTTPPLTGNSILRLRCTGNLSFTA